MARMIRSRPRAEKRFPRLTRLGKMAVPISRRKLDQLANSGCSPGKEARKRPRQAIVKQKMRRDQVREEV